MVGAFKRLPFGLVPPTEVNDKAITPMILGSEYPILTIRAGRASRDISI